MSTPTDSQIFTSLNPDDTRPVLLLDVDGVINDLVALRNSSQITADIDDWAAENGYQVFWASIRERRTDTFRIFMPDYMPALIAHLDSVCEIVWCTTWLDSANDDIATRLGVGPFPALHPLRISDWNWKPDAAREVLSQAAAAGREVFWIEDFCSNLPRNLTGPITFLDTAPAMVLTPTLLPEALRPAAPLTVTGR